MKQPPQSRRLTYQSTSHLSPDERQQRRMQVYAWLLGLSAWPDEPTASPEPPAGDATPDGEGRS